MNKTYLLKQRSFMFNDENYHCVLDGEYGAITYKSNNLEDLTEQWKSLEFQYAHLSSWLHMSNNENELYSSLSFQKVIQKHKCNRTNQYDNDQILSNLNKEDLFDILIELDANAFSCIEYIDLSEFYVLWNTTEDHYDISDANVPELEPPQLFLSKAESLEKLINNYAVAKNIPEKLVGSLQELSESPTLLQAIIEQYPCFHFKNNLLKIKEADTNAILAINDLLKTPLFTYKKLSLDEIIQIELNLNKNLETDCDDFKEHL